MPLPLGAVVRHGERFGTVTRGHRRASRGMVWVVWEGQTVPVLWHRFTLVYVARRGPVATVRAMLQQIADLAGGG